MEDKTSMKEKEFYHFLFKEKGRENAHEEISMKINTNLRVWANQIFSKVKCQKALGHEVENETTLFQNKYVHVLLIHNPKADIKKLHQIVNVNFIFLQTSPKRSSSTNQMAGEEKT